MLLRPRHHSQSWGSCCAMADRQQMAMLTAAAEHTCNLKQPDTQLSICSVLRFFFLSFPS